ncbi:TIGR03032 family protein [Fulvivirga ulvae]|uniref:TIGR03032 family protein n=1 Tax=Fulvivirga ulvae TaxID=2904245 RepID=UPI001F1D8F39|nr:TIGR03032 family protein [Fulvivirga ulvae]UII31748.1 TIGR03032 family protein [Fulvivirga ulvae]
MLSNEQINMSNPLPPFTCSYSPNIPELLNQLNCTIAISTYQAGKVILISAVNTTNLIQLPRNFQKPMGMAFDGKKMAVATRDEVIILANSPEMAPNYPKQPNTYDSLYLPRVTYYSGAIDIHDLEWVEGKLWAVNTLFSCLVTLDEDYSFKPVWKPSFVPAYEPGDFCHLNGLAMENGSPRFVSALGDGNTPESWRANKANGGVIIDVETCETITRNLAMPHSPRIYDGELFALLSATGELIKIDIHTGKYEVIKKFDGFVRGMVRHGDYLFIGLSKLRENSSAFRDLPIAKRSLFCGIIILHLPTVGIVGHIKYESSVEEIYDVKIMAGSRRPGLLNHEGVNHKVAITSPVGDFWAVKNDE